ncbi:MAG: 16S rRNA (cytidine(1402)-2'-O)-methyltransferase [Xanthomonadaceae bacterium]|nr:16S rRNA (cytidine(1402)-2'-O)-methyltransferase [Rhodospirillaceae bacterium]NIA18062.1 16S rRNA (cytidine(1402)-2'-O)-methyltransferase [Xanthomonadaceae bacterium]
MKQEKTKLYIVATPIGNLEDITFRAIEILKQVDFILCEDTRVTKRLLDHYKIETPTIAYHQHSSLSKTENIIKLLYQEKNLALVTDAGTPGISDPGNKLIEKINQAHLDILIIPIPGPSALSTLVSVAGINMQKFIFLGFPPHKKGREKFFKEVANSKIPIIYYESPYRVLKNLELLKNFCDKKVIIGREITKMFEEIIRGDIEYALKYFENKKIKGEFTIIVY